MASSKMVSCNTFSIYTNEIQIILEQNCRLECFFPEIRFQLLQKEIVIHFATAETETLEKSPLNLQYYN